MIDFESKCRVNEIAEAEDSHTDGGGRGRSFNKSTQYIDEPLTNFFFSSFLGKSELISSYLVLRWIFLSLSICLCGFRSIHWS